MAVEVLFSTARTTEKTQRARGSEVITYLDELSSLLSLHADVVRISFSTHHRDLELSQIEVETFDSSSVSLSSTSLDIRYRPADSLGETLPETFSPISPNADRSLIQPLGYCVDEFRTSVSIEPPGGLIWNLKDFAKAGKLLKSPSMSVEFYDEYEMRKVYSLIYDVFRCK